MGIATTSRPSVRPSVSLAVTLTYRDHIIISSSHRQPLRHIISSARPPISQQESHAVAGKPRDAAVNSDRYRVRWHFAGAISVSRMQSVSGCTVYA